ncbi:MAG: hypothetical protein KDB22_17215 [Planctomycetales bacterium]|nr:hypothetical protein [Planctomycetales bacterium]
MQDRIRVLFGIGFWMACASIGSAQVVQLPSMGSVSYSGTVMAPDAGTVSLGGVGTGYQSRNSLGFGPYSSRSTSSAGGSRSLLASAQIIDLKALDDALLSANISQKDVSSAAVLSANSPASGGGRSFLSGIGSNSNVGSGQNIPAPGQWQRAMANSSEVDYRHPSTAEADIRFYLLKGKEAEAANHLNAARVYYRMAVAAMTPEMTQRYYLALEQRKEQEAQQQQKSASKSF